MTILVRGVLVVDGHILLARRPSADWTFLPGGHVEEGEALISALSRELKEELGRQFVIEGYLGAFEHHWNDDNKCTHEINHLFDIGIAWITPDMPMNSREPDLEFCWAKVAKLSNYHLKPESLVPFIQKYARHGGS